MYISLLVDGFVYGDSVPSNGKKLLDRMDFEQDQTTRGQIFLLWPAATSIPVSMEYPGESLSKEDG